MLLYGIARRNRWDLLPLAFALTAMAGKYFLLVLAIPLALASPRPPRELLRCVLASAAALALYIGYHQLRFGLTPILGYDLDPAAAISAWALAWNLGFQPPGQTLEIASILATGGLVVVFCWLARRRGFPPLFSVAGTLWIALLCVSIAMPPYLLWNLPFLLMIWLMLDSAPLRWTHAGLVYLWGGIAYAAKLLRGVELALTMDRTAGKTAIGEWAVRILGGDFPFAESHLALRALLVAIGVAFLALLWMEATQTVRRERSASAIAATPVRNGRRGRL
jgi:hypothetical protein